MTADQESRSPLETEPVQKLIVRYAIPTALTLMVNCLYNIVDQIFVGQGVGITAMAAINVAFPVVILVNAVALLLGDGSAANISLCLGRRQQQEADDTIGHAATLIAASGLCAAIVSWCFAPQIARRFGATDTAWPEAAAYLRTIAWGLPFQLICPAFTAIIRADGHPRYSMGCMITGAVLNLILDPVFIFPLGMGVVGAGIATVIGQVAAGVLFLAYLPRLHTVRLRRQALRPTIRLTGRILTLGVPSLLTQILTALVQITLNNLLRVHGAASVYGSDIALCLRNDDEGLSDCPLHVRGRLLRRTAYQRLQLRGEAFSSGAADLPHGRRHRPGNFGGVVPGVPAVSPADRDAVRL